ncbi:TPM domain-containing protein [Clostridium saudiense]|nr:TPM domain-containing protein [Clostridium saudiense]
MRKIAGRISMIVMIMIICIPLTGRVNAELKRVVDRASLFSSEEIVSLENSINDISTRYEMDIVIVTTDDVEGKSSRDYADDFFD